MPLRIGKSRTRRAARGRRVLAALALLLAAAPHPALAKLCGDDVGGRDVPCACGDTVVSNLVLSNDPVASTVCPSDALLVRAPEAAEGVTIDLRGKTLRGSGRGTGVWVLAGGPGGARVSSGGSRAVIEGFYDGVVAHGPDTIALLEDLTVRGCKRDGVRIGSAGYQVRAVEVESAGRDGFALSGSGWQIASTRATGNGRHGYMIMGQGGSIGTPWAGNTAENNRHTGFSVMGAGHQLLGCTASNNMKDGLMVRGAGIEMHACVARANGNDGIAGMGNEWRLSGNRADDNGANGLVARGTNMLDEGGNGGSGNRGGGQQRPVQQCEIGGAPCAP